MRPSVNESFRTSEVTARPSVNGGIDNFQPGDRVEINNLNVAPEFNGTMGTVEEWLTAKKKWRVKCDYDGKDNKLASKYLTLKLKHKVKDDGGIVTGRESGFANVLFHDNNEGEQEQQGTAV